ncbi:S1/P1 nuclease [Mesorhizobium sp. INR15]|uniref:S1/P1 nuclease n=1 Tax=Mesorhizobium sp. INR15 TaxID=2654248 RepID=UPI00215618BF|nr:S1/P1 nuclease [Mesorhizobium sp. INR15]
MGETATPAEAIAAIASLPPPDPIRSAVSDPGAWFHESYDLARQYVYTSDIKEDKGPYAVPQSYVDDAKTLAQSQASIAAARLANLLNNALK